MEINVPVFIDTETQNAVLVFAVGDDSAIEVNINIGGIEVPVRNKIFTRLLIAESHAAGLLAAPEKIEASSSWSAFLPPRSSGGTVVFSPPAPPVHANSALGLQEELANVIKLMTIIPGV